METESMRQCRKYKQWQKQKRKTAIVEIVSTILLLSLFAFFVKLWFVAEGFAIKW